MNNAESRLVGAWQRSSAAPCAAQYPAHWQVEANGLYSGQTEPPGEFTLWDSGTWRVKAPGELALSVANDEVIPYRYTLAGDVLSITDAQGCRFDYRRSG